MTINRNAILRLSQYRNALRRLKKIGFVKVFSDNIADATRESSLRVRKDFSMFGISGNRKGGYIIDELIEAISNILGKNANQNVVVFGAGKIGTALMEYHCLNYDSIHIVAGFDSDPAKHNEKSDTPVYPISQLKKIVKKYNVKIGVIAVPEQAAQKSLETMVAAGIQGILNFAPVRLTHSDDVVITNVNLKSELENLIYFVLAGANDVDI